MRITCTTHDMSALPRKYFSPAGIYNPKAESERSITPGKEYTVYGIIVSRGMTYYYICTDNYSDFGSISYPQWRPAPFFIITDGAISRTWRTRFRPVDDDDAGELLIAPKEWVEDRFFYDKLTDGDDQAINSSWLAMKESIDSEFTVG